MPSRFGFLRDALKGVLGGLEDWLYSEEADDAGLAELKEKRRQASVFVPYATIYYPFRRSDPCQWIPSPFSSALYSVLFGEEMSSVAV